jgi:NAD(P)-dependent dehydrogenase (short-subunit alcohol dehydrogenase family)
MLVILVGMTAWSPDAIPDQTGRTILITGANSGLGYASTRALAARGATVVMAVRNEAKGNAAREALLAEHPTADIRLRAVDLADLESVRALAAGLVADGVSLDVLMNNAGVMMPPRTLSPQGQESQFAANHLGHFALTGLLLDRLTPDGRVVVLSSVMHRTGRIHFDDLTGARRYSPMGFYSQSKLANTLFGLELDRRLRAGGHTVRAVLAHPGYAATNLQVTGPSRMIGGVMKVLNPLLAQPAAAGAWSQLQAATDPGAQGGDFFGPGQLMGMRGRPVKVRAARAATDPASARRLWELSEDLTGVRYGLPTA